MAERTILVKEKSIDHFLGRSEERANKSGISDSHYLLADEIILPKRSDLFPGFEVQFEIADRATKSGKELTMLHIYEIKTYDSVSVKLTRTEIRIAEEATTAGNIL